MKIVYAQCFVVLLLLFFCCIYVCMSGLLFSCHSPDLLCQNQFACDVHLVILFDGRMKKKKYKKCTYGYIKVLRWPSSMCWVWSDIWKSALVLPVYFWKIICFFFHKKNMQSKSLHEIKEKFEKTQT